MFQNLPIDILKIDMKFIQNAEGSRRGTIVLESVVGMAKRLDIPVIIEGVETQEQLDYVTRLGCDEVQGYFYSRPCRPRHLVKFLQV